ncbi:MAG: hypothetical protein H6730_26020 [Deltaproteobacteria bacterium]|nr:hypothetical protein [Deltaproteobacteria bacterium]
MRCPACNKTVEPDAWLCPFCEHIIDASVLEDTDGDDLASSEPTKMMLNPLAPEPEGPLPDAMILGDVGIAEDEFAVVEGAGVQSDGRTSTFLYYAGGASTRVVHPEAIPRLTTLEHDQPRTPYEDFILSCIDGVQTVRQIQKTSGLQPQEVVVTLLTLMDKGAVVIRTADGGPGASPPIGRATEDAPQAPAKKKRARKQRDPSPTPAAVAPQPLDDDDVIATQALVTPVPEPAPAAFPVPLGFDEDDIPSVSDFHEILAEAPTGDLEAIQPDDDGRAFLPLTHGVPDDDTQMGTPPPTRRAESLSDVWAESSAPLNADALIEDEAHLDETDEVPDVLVVPSPLDLPPEEDERPPLTPPIAGPTGLDEDLHLAPVVPTDLDDGDSDVTKEIYIPVKPRPPEPRPASLPFPAPPPPLTVHPTAPSVRPSPRPAPSVRPASAVVVPATTSSGQAPLLDPALLQPAEPSQVGAAPARALVDAVRRAPVMERRPGLEAPRPAEPEPAPSAPPAPEPPKEPERASREPADPVDSLRMMKGQKLFDQALKDKADGNLVSARMNMKLAITFDPTNELYAEALEELSKNPDASRGSPQGPPGRSRAREYYDAATEAENIGDVDKAIELLEKAVAESRQAVFLNRLGVILATKRKDFLRAQDLIQQAIELSPGNATYEKNLHKVLSRAATHDVNKADAGKKGGGRLLGFLGRRK